MINFFTGVLIIAAAAFAALLLPKKIKAPSAAVLITAGCAIAVIPALQVLITGGSWSIFLPMAAPFGAVRILIDPLSAVFILIIALGSSAGAVYAVGYLSPYMKAGKSITANVFFYALLCASMLMVTVVHHALFFLVVWEIMSLASTFGVLFYHEEEETVRSGIFYAVAMHIGAAFLAAGFIILSLKAHSYDFSAFVPLLAHGDRFADGIFVLFFIGFGLKAGFVPLHTWLPKAHPAAPSHISALMSGVMIKTGIYGILRIIVLSGTPSKRIALMVLTVAAVTALFGIMNALTRRDIKKLLAYSSIENIGIIGMGIGFGMLGMNLHNENAAFLGFAGALFHTVNHSLFKGILFYGAGAVFQQTHTRDMEKLGGLIHRLPRAATCMMIGSAAICALPPLNGFAGELIILLGMLGSMGSSSISVNILAVAGLAVIGFVGAMAVITFTKLFAITFQGQPRSEYAQHAHEPSLTMILLMGFFALLCVLLGFFPQYVLYALYFPADLIVSAGMMSGLSAGPFIDAMPVLETVSRAALFLAGIVIVLLTLRAFLLRGRKVEKGPTWGCGYRAGSARIQYTAHSFIHPFVFHAGKVSGSHSDTKLPEGIFPTDARFTAKSSDLIEANLVDPPVRLVAKILGRFPELQTGRTQIYILYGFVFLIACLLWTMMGGK